MKRLVVFGDSWPRGYERSLGYHNWNKSFVDYIAESLGWEVKNFSYPGHSNSAILNEFVHYLEFEHKPDDVALFVWSDNERITIFNDGVESNELTYWLATLDSKKEDKLKSEYVRPESDPYHHRRFKGGNQHRRFRVLNNIDVSDDAHFKRLLSMGAYHVAKGLCEQKNIPYRMTTSMDTNLLNDRYIHLSTVDAEKRTTKITVYPIEPMMDKNNPNWIEGTEKNNTLTDIIDGNWLTENNKPPHYHLSDIEKMKKMPLFTDCLHPTEEGHKVIAKTLLPYMESL